MLNLLTLHGDRVLQPPLAPDAREARSWSSGPRTSVSRTSAWQRIHAWKKDMASGVIVSSQCSRASIKALSSHA